MADEEWVDIGAAARFAARPLAHIAQSRAGLSISHRDGQFGAISGVRACLTVLLLLLVTQIASAGAAESAPPGTSIPSIAGIAKIKIGYWNRVYRIYDRLPDHVDPRPRGNTERFVRHFMGWT